MEVKSLRTKELGVPQPSISPAPSLAVESDAGSGSQDVSPVRPRSAESEKSTPPAPQGIPDTPPGLSGPPGLPPPSRKLDPLTPPGIHPSQSTYQISTAAQALLDDVKSRRENAPSVSSVSIFPDLDRTLRMVSGEDNEFGGFSFNLDPKLAGDDLNVDISLPDLEAEANTPLTGGFMDVFPALRPTQPPAQVQHPRASFMTPPGLAYPHNPNRSIYDSLPLRGTPAEHQSAGGPGYVGSFNPFGEVSEDPIVQPQGISSTSRKSPFVDEERKVSRFGFARGRQGSTAASSPVNPASPLSASDSHHSFFSSETTSSAQPHWNLSSHIEHGFATSSFTQHGPVTQPHSHSQPQQHARFQPFDHNIVSEAQLREFIQSSRERASVMPTGPPGRKLLFV